MKIELETIQEFFADNWNRGIALERREMLWTHHFVDPSKDELARIIPTLRKAGYFNVEIVALESGYLLQASEIRSHTVESLHAKCAELDQLANQNEIADYDGFDVGNVDGTILDKT